MAIGKLLPRTAACALSAHRPDRRFAAGKLGHHRGWAANADPPENIRGLVTPPLPFAEAERKAGPNGLEHNTVAGKLPTAQMALFAGPLAPCRPDRGSQGLGVSSLNRPAPPRPSGFSSSGRIALSSPASVHGGLTINSPAEVRPGAAAWGATLNSRRRHLPAGVDVPVTSATYLARLSEARRLFTGYHNR